jgi:hypothetical protein
MKFFDSKHFAGVGDYIVSVTGSTGDYDLTLRSGLTIEEYDETAGVFSTAAPSPGDVLLLGSQTGTGASRAADTTDLQVVPATLALSILRQQDLAPVEVVSMSFADGDDDIAIDEAFDITWNKDIASDVDASFTLLDDTTPVACTITFSGAVSTITPDANLDNSTEYTLAVAAGAVTDEAGNQNAAVGPFTFTTVAA